MGDRSPASSQSASTANPAITLTYSDAILVLIMKYFATVFLAGCCASVSAFSEVNPTPNNPPPSVSPNPPSNGARFMAGAVAPLGFFDPLGFSASADLNTLKRYREAETVHGRVAMLAVAGTFGGESLHEGAVIDHLYQTPKPLWVFLLFSVSFIELLRAQIGWVEPEKVPIDQPGLLRSNYVPGNLGFDPLGLAPRDPLEFKVMQTKELSNGRLAMISMIGVMAQEAVNHKGIVESLMG